MSEHMKQAVQLLQDACHGESKARGWWNDPCTGSSILARPHVIGEKLMLVVKEVSEAMEGHRKDSMDTHLPHRKMIEVELADAMIRICDLGGALGLDLAGALVEKMAYNRTRPDHSIAARAAEGGKRC